MLDFLAEPQTIYQLTRRIFPNVQGYHELLAIEETGAHVEYLYQRGRLEIANLTEINQRPAVPVRYQRLPAESK